MAVEGIPKEYQNKGEVSDGDRRAMKGINN